MDMKEVFKTLGKEHRIEILKSLEKEPGGIYDTYNVLKVESPDIYTSVIERALKELWKVGLVYRDEKKRFNITAYGTFILWSILDLPDREVLTYLKEKQIDLPEELLKDMPCVLKHASVVRGAMNIASEFLRIQREAEKEVLYIIERPLLSQKVLENNLNMLRRGVKTRCILDKDNFNVHLYKEMMKGVIDEEVVKEFSRAFLLNQSEYDVETKFFSNVKLGLYVADRKLVAIVFPDTYGETRMDSGILSYDPKTVEWGQKIFEHYWQKSDRNAE